MRGLLTLVLMLSTFSMPLVKVVSSATEVDESVRALAAIRRKHLDPSRKVDSKIVEHASVFLRGPS